MTESEWLNERASAQTLLDQVVPQRSESPQQRRKLRLIACGSCRLIWEGLVDPRLRRAVEVAEFVADGLGSVAMLDKVRAEAAAAVQALPTRDHLYLGTAAGFVRHCLETDARIGASNSLTSLLPLIGSFSEHSPDTLDIQCRLVRDLFGNPFHAVALLPEWRTSAVISLTQSMYVSRDFSSMPMLSDALQDAGCDIAEILDHCRSPGPHVRGCWVVDRLLGKD
jgi:hypothetical protein